jgi:hypothetical protein
MVDKEYFCIIKTLISSHGLHRKWWLTWTHKGSGRISTMKKAELQNTQEQIEKSHRQDQERITWQNMR